MVRVASQQWVCGVIIQFFPHVCMFANLQNKMLKNIKLKFTLGMDNALTHFKLQKVQEL